MIPFHVDPRWYEEHWYDDPPDESEALVPRRPGIGRAWRIAVCAALVAALPVMSYLGFWAALRSPAVPPAALVHRG